MSGCRLIRGCFFASVVAFYGGNAVAETVVAPSDPMPQGIILQGPVAPNFNRGPAPARLPVLPEHAPVLHSDVPMGVVGAANFDEPLIRVNPTNPANVIVSSHNGMRISTDFGQSFPTAVTFPNGLGGSNGDTATTFDSAGRLFWANLLNANDGDIQFMEVNPTTGATVSDPINVQKVASDNIAGFDDKEFMVADEYAASAYTDNQYMIWTKFSTAGPPATNTEVFVSRSTDSGVNWSTPLQLSDYATEGFPWPSDIAVAPNGDVYAAYHAGGSSGAGGLTYVLRSTDGGQTFAQKTLAFTAGQSDITFNVQSDPGPIPNTHFWMQGAAQPWVLPDPARPGQVYVVSNDDPDNNHGSGDDADVVFARSTDNGQTWNVTTIADSGDSHQLFPFAAIDSNGNIVVAWYDTRAGATNGNDNLLLDVWATYSTDGGQTWAPAFQVNDADNPFDPEFPSQQRRFPTPQQTPCVVTGANPETCRIGEYFAIDIDGGSVYLAWVGNTFDGMGAVTGDQLWFDRFDLPADLRITKTTDTNPVVPGQSVQYTIQVFNDSASVDVHGATVTDTFSADLTGVSWTCSASAGSSCTSPGTGNISDTVNIQAGGSLTYTVTATVAASATGNLSNTATVTTAGTDSDLTNNTATVSNALIPQVDLAVSKVESVDPVIAGSGSGNLTYTVTVTNNGPSDATGVTLSEVITLPAGVSIDSITPSGSGSYAPANSANGTWTVGNLAANASATLTVVLSVGADAADGSIISDTASVTNVDQPDTDNTNDSATEQTTVQRQVDLQVAVVDSIDPVVAGSGAGNLTYTATLSNAGPSDASGVTLSEVLTLPADTTIVSITPSGSGSYAPANSANGTWTVGNLAANASATLTVVLTVGPSAPDGSTVSSAVAVTAANETLINTPDDSATAQTTVPRQVDLRVAVVDSIDPVVAGSGAGNLTYTATLSNAGPSDASGVTLSEVLTLPADTTIVSITPSGSGSYAPANSANGTWTVGNLAANASATLTVVLTVGPSAPDGSTVSSAVAVTAANETLINTADDAATETTGVIARADLSVTKRSDQDPILTLQSGDAHFNYEITVSNAGPSTAVNVVATDVMVPVDGVHILQTDGCLNDPNGVADCQLGTLLPGESQTYLIRMVIHGGLDATLSNSVSVTSDIVDPNPNNNAVVVENRVLPPVSVPTLGVWGLAVLIALMGLVGGLRRRC